MDGDTFQPLLFQIAEPHEVSQSTAQEAIKPYLKPITDAVLGAFEEYRRINETTRIKFSSQVRGQIVTDLIWKHVQDNLSGTNGVSFCHKLRFFKLVVDDTIAVRFKRLNRALLAASEDTDQAMAWFGNRPLGGIPDHLLRVNFGYRPNADWTDGSAYYFSHQASFTAIEWISSVTLTDPSLESLPAHGLKGVEITPINPPVFDPEAKRAKKDWA